MSALDDLLDSNSRMFPPGTKGGTEVKAARAELARLRADLQAAQERIAQLEAELAFSDAEKDRQERQLDGARQILENILKRDWTNTKIHDKTRAWLAANPAPQVEQP